jgi:prepilin-type N-terminal cleavage/methylation domain-containing protein/prepilin-type processing-associated H-X9-DG protein
MMRRISGFTLVELLVVIAIIAILAAILFPVFAMARQAGSRATCSANLMQIGKALKLYVQDSNGRYPPMDDGSYGKFRTWHDFIAGYSSHNKRIFRCPAHRPETDPGILDRFSNGWPSNPPYAYSYGINYNWVGGGGSGDAIVANDNADIPLGRIVLVAETNWCWFQTQEETADGKWTQGANWYKNYIEWRHPLPTRNGTAGTRDGRANFLFVDGHVLCIRKYLREATGPSDPNGFFILPPGGYGAFDSWFGIK